MYKYTFTQDEFYSDFERILELASSENEPVEITRSGKSSLILLSESQYESLQQQ